MYCETTFNTKDTTHFAHFAIIFEADAGKKNCRNKWIEFFFHNHRLIRWIYKIKLIKLDSACNIENTTTSVKYKKNVTTLCRRQWRIQDFSDRGRRPLSLDQRLTRFLPKSAWMENERNWTGGGASLAPTPWIRLWSYIWCLSLILMF